MKLCMLLGCFRKLFVRWIWGKQKSSEILSLRRERLQFHTNLSSKEVYIQNLWNDRTDEWILGYYSKAGRNLLPRGVRRWFQTFCCKKNGGPFNSFFTVEDCNLLDTTLTLFWRQLQRRNHLRYPKTREEEILASEKNDTKTFLKVTDRCCWTFSTESA